MNIAWKELFVILVAVHTWGTHWARKKILFHCDNQSVVDIWGKGSTPDPQIMALVRFLYFRAAQHNINICVIHIPGTDNDLADAISCFQMAKFCQLAPAAQSTPDLIPAWPTESFTRTSCNAAIMALPPPPGTHTNLASQASDTSTASTTSRHCQQLR